MKAYGSGCIDPLFLTSALVGGEWSTSRPGRFTPRGKSPRYPLDRRLGGPQSRSGRSGEEKILSPTGTRLLGNMMAAQFLVDSVSCCRSLRVLGPFYENSLACSVDTSACPVTLIVDGVITSEAVRNA
jgi:hypothetical protein